MKIDELNNRHIKAEEGKVFRRISDGQLFGNEIYLGYTYYLKSEILAKPLLELPEHFEEINDPAEEEIILLDESTPLEGFVEVIPEENQDLAEEPIAVKISGKVTLADFHRLEKQVELLMKMIGGVE
jgi:hypothetical protein